MKLIEDWLTGKRNFMTGRSIYKVIGKDEALKKLFAKGETVFAKNKLNEALENLIFTPAAVLSAEDLSLSEMPHEDDAVLQSIEAGWKEKYARMNLLRHKLDEYGTDNSQETITSCEPICKEVLTLEKEINALWKQRDHYKQHGQLPGVTTQKKELSANLNEAAKQLENIKKNIRRNKDLMNCFKEDPAHAQRYNDYLNRFKEITGEDYKERKK